MKYKAVFLGTALFLQTLDVGALSLGRPQGAVWIGRTLSVSIPVRFDVPEDVAGLCPQADVFNGEQRLPADSIRVSVSPGSDPREPSVLVRSLSVVDEPVVTVYLHLGCTQRSTRRYVLLAEPPAMDTPVTAPAAVATGQPATAVLPARPSSASLVAPASRPPASAAAPMTRLPRVGASGAAPFPRPEAPVRAEGLVRPRLRAASASSPSAASSASKAPGKAVLKLDPAELLIERTPVLRFSTSLSPADPSAEGRRAEWAAIWRALNASPEDILRGEQQLRAARGSLERAEALVKSRQNEVASLNAELQRLKDERSTASNLLYLVSGLLAVAVGAAVYLWRRSGQGESAGRRNWWTPRSRQESETHWQEPEPLPGAVSSPAPKDTRLEAGQGKGSLGVDVDVSSHDAKATAGAASAPLVRHIPADSRTMDPDFESSVSGSSRALKVEELFDVQQEADFFISLGQYDQAVAVLRNHIGENAETSALAYLDLLKIYHLQGREKEYELVRKEFNQVFNAQVPEFGSFDQKGRGLEAYQGALSRIVSLWPSSRVLDVIEESIFRKPGGGVPAFDLEAYRELLMLYAVAKEIVEAGGPEQVGTLAPPRVRPTATDSNFGSTNLQPLVTTVAETGHDQDLLRVPTTPHLGLDIDLGDLIGPDEVPTLPAAVSPPVAEEPVPMPTLDLDFDLSNLGASRPVPPTPAQPEPFTDFDLFDRATTTVGPKKRL